MADTRTDPPGRLTLSDVRVLAALTGDPGAEAPAPSAVRLTELGFMDAGRVTEEGAVVGETLREAVAGLTMRVTGLGAAYVGTGWVGEELSLLAIPTGPGDDPLCEVSLVPTPTLTTLIARFVELGPRANRLPQGMLYTTRSALAKVLGAGSAPSPSAVAELLDGLEDDRADAWVRSLTSPRSLNWRVEVTALDGDALPLRTCEAIDCGEDGMWVVSDSPGTADQLLLVAATPTYVWRLLSSLFSEPRPGIMPPVPDDPIVANLL